ncbi:alpha/beta hydrolase family protein [Lysinibacillus fusiformis]|uniref:alpha/beta hydrolase family protein n=1 Tax=Lysinibacillus fusiformis TaxID=28031 RepID=UPI00378897E1
MRFFEMIFIVFNILLIVWIIFAKSKPLRGLLICFGVSTLLMLLQWCIEGIRWQMIPAYVMTVVPLAAAMGRIIFKQKSSEAVTKKASRVKYIAVTVLAIIYSLLAVVLPLLFPVFTFEEPRGPYQIGTITYDWVDEQREETFTPAPKDKRRLVVQVWYPADSKAKGKSVPYLSDGDAYAKGLSKALNMPKLLFTTFDHVKTHAMENVEISNRETAYPVLLFSHGFNMYKNQNTFQIEQLVSQGYIVVGIEHAYSSAATIFADGRVAYYMQQDKDSADYLDQANEGWVEDAKFTLDQLEKLVENDPDQRFTGRLDMENVGMFGHSFGGATSTQMLMRDSRIKAAINMDGALYGKVEVPEEGLQKPFLLMSADYSLNITQQMTDQKQVEMMERVLARYEHVTEGGNYWLTINHNDHVGFTDFYLLSPLFERMVDVDIRKVHRMINDYSLDFFNHYLKQQSFKLLEQNIGEHLDYTLHKG